MDVGFILKGLRYPDAVPKPEGIIRPIRERRCDCRRVRTDTADVGPGGVVGGDQGPTHNAGSHRDHCKASSLLLCSIKHRPFCALLLHCSLAPRSCRPRCVGTQDRLGAATNTRHELLSPRGLISGAQGGWLWAAEAAEDPGRMHQVQETLRGRGHFTWLADVTVRPATHPRCCRRTSDHRAGAPGLSELLPRVPTDGQTDGQTAVPAATTPGRGQSSHGLCFCSGCGCSCPALLPSHLEHFATGDANAWLVVLGGCSVSGQPCPVKRAADPK
nr:uncharacterized protein LOC110366164 [Columba livia]